MTVNILERISILAHASVGGNISTQLTNRLLNNIHSLTNEPAFVLTALKKKCRKHPELFRENFSGDVNTNSSGNKVDKLKHRQQLIHSYKIDGGNKDNEHLNNSQVKAAKVKLAEKILQFTRGFYSGSSLKSANKFRYNRTPYNHMESAIKINDMRTHSNNIEELLLRSVFDQAGNCDEMAYIAYAYCYKYGLAPTILHYDDTKNDRFGHIVCQIELDGEKFIIDPWANIFCPVNEFINQLIAKLDEWETKHKFVLTPFPMHMKSINALYSDSNFLYGKKINREDILNLEIIGEKASHLNGNIVSESFYTRVREFMADWN